MARPTVVSHTQVIKVSPGKVVEFVGYMAIRTVPGGRHMIRVLPFTYVSIVTRRAVISNTSVIKNCPLKGGCGQVTVGAILVVGISWYMIIMLTRSDHPIVAGRAGNGGNVDTQIMIKHASGKGPRGVTITTIKAARHVIDRHTAS